MFRRHAEDGAMVGDLLALESERTAGEALIRPVMRQGRRLELPSLEDARGLARAQLERLPAHLKRLDTQPAYPVEVSAPLQALAREIDCLEMAGR